MDFNDTEIAFRIKSTRDLYNARLLFGMIDNPALVSFFKFVTNLALGVHLPVGWAVKPTLYRQFVGGETLEQCATIVSQLKDFNVTSVLDFSAEGGKSRKSVERAYNEIMRSVDHIAENPEIPYTVFKPTAMVLSEVLEKAARVERFPGKFTPLTDAESSEIEDFKNRVLNLCRKAYEKGVKILIDAEHFLTQDIIDEITEQAMEMFNRERAIVFHTLQMYRRDRLDYLKRLHADAREKGYIPGIKFVRGAYMDQERALASEGGYDDPIHPTKEATDNSYDSGLRYVVENIDSFELFSGTHNYESNYLLASLIDEHGLKRDDPRIFSSQLYGMSDNISFVMAGEGFNVCKYIPYAPVRDVLPYLLRRAEENSSVSGQTSRELSLIRKEISRRKSLNK
jgi:proline dehydrogenase